MTSDSHILVVAATPRELASDGPWRTLLCGVGPVEAAAATAGAIAVDPPAAILHVGIAGARRARAVPPCSIVIGSESRYCDLTVPAEWAPSVVPAAPHLIEAVRGAVPDALLLPIGTSASVGASSGCDIEAMEGFGVLRSAQRAAIPAVEVRAVANDIEEPDRGLWHFDAAFAAINAVTPRIVAAIVERLRHA